MVVRRGLAGADRRTAGPRARRAGRGRRVRGANSTIEHRPDVALLDLSDARARRHRRDPRDPCRAARRHTSRFSPRLPSLHASAPRLDAGAIGYLLKDAEPEELIAGIRLVAAGASPLAAEAARALAQGRSGLPAAGSLTPRERSGPRARREGLLEQGDRASPRDQREDREGAHDATSFARSAYSTESRRRCGRAITASVRCGDDRARRALSSRRRDWTLVVGPRRGTTTKIQLCEPAGLARSSAMLHSRRTNFGGLSMLGAHTRPARRGTRRAGGTDTRRDRTRCVLAFRARRDPGSASPPGAAPARPGSWSLPTALSHAASSSSTTISAVTGGRATAAPARACAGSIRRRVVNPPWTTNWCSGTAKGGGQIVVGNTPTTAADGSKYIYLADDGSKSTQVIRYKFNPHATATQNPLSVDARDERPERDRRRRGHGRRASVALALAPNGQDLYVGYLKSGDVMKVTDAMHTASGTPPVARVGSTSDGRGVNAFTLFKGDLYLAELGGARTLVDPGSERRERSSGLLPRPRGAPRSPSRTRRRSAASRAASPARRSTSTSRMHRRRRAASSSAGIRQRARSTVVSQGRAAVLRRVQQQAADGVHRRDGARCRARRRGLCRRRSNGRGRRRDGRRRPHLRHSGSLRSCRRARRRSAELARPPARRPAGTRSRSLGANFDTTAGATTVQFGKVAATNRQLREHDVVHRSQSRGDRHGRRDASRSPVRRARRTRATRSPTRLRHRRTRCR